MLKLSVCVLSGCLDINTVVKKNLDVDIITTATTQTTWINRPDRLSPASNHDIYPTNEPLGQPTP